MWRILAGLVLLTVLVACAAPPTKTPSASSSTRAAATTSSATTAPAAAPVVAPVVISLPVPFAEEKNSITIDPVDVGQHIVDGVDHERSIFDSSNWRVVAQCDQMIGTTLTAGVIKADEFATISAAGQGASISDNTFKTLLTCP